MSGAVSRNNDRPIRVGAICSGDAYAMGVDQGTKLRERILAAREALEQLEAFRQEQPRWLPYRAFRRLAERKARRLWSDALARDYPEMSRQLAGIADGAQANVETIYLFNALEPLLSNLRGRVVMPCPGACSAVAIGPHRSMTEEPFIAKNFDYLPLVQPFYTLRQCNPANGLRSLDFTVAPLAGTVDGINEKGLCITNNYAFTVDESPPSGTISMAISEALKRCTTLSEAAEWIGSRPRWGGGLLMMADATGDIASLELSGTRSRLRRPRPGAEVLFHTNAFACSDMRAVEIDKSAVFTDRAPKALRGRRVQESAELRDCRLAELLGESGQLSPDDLACIMADHGPDGIPGDYTLCVHGEYWNTTACLQLFPQSRRLRVDYAYACQANYQEFQI